MKASIYLRTSDDKQINNTSFETQESVSRSYCNREEYEVVDIVENEAVSANKNKSQRIIELLEYCQANKGKFDVLVVYRLDRFARSQEQHHWLRGHLNKLGIILRSATERIDESGSGKLIEGVLAAVNEYDNDIRTERSRMGMIRRLEDGLWPWMPPTGYCLPKEKEVKLSISKFDDNCYNDMKDMFKMYSTGNYSFSYIATDLTRRNLKNWKGTSLIFTKQKVEKLINNPFYAGFTLSCIDNVLRKAKHSPLISMKLWEKCQKIKKQGTSNNTIRRKNNPHFPLRGFVLGSCGHVFTAAFSKGRHGGKFGYYFCQEKDSGYHKSELLHDKFTELLYEIKPEPECVDLYLEMFEEEVIKSYQEKEQRRKRLLIEKDSLKDKSSRLLDLRIEGEIDEFTYKAKRQSLEREDLLLEQELSHSEMEQTDWQKVTKFAKNFFTHIPERWEKLEIEGKKVMLGSIFEEKLQWDGESYLTPKLPEVFREIRDIKTIDVTPRGIEPRFSG
jgi:site-specific DNA recombinase